MEDSSTLATIAALIQAAANVSAVIVACLALYLAYKAEKRNQDRFDAQLRQSRELTQASIIPLLQITSEKFEDMKAIKLVNRGIGPAIITNIKFSRGTQETDYLLDLFRKPLVEYAGRPFKWAYLRGLDDKRTFVGANQTIDLMRLSAKNLCEQEEGFTPSEALAILDRWQQLKSGIEVRIEYKDALENEKPLTKNL
jgi:hypothetical protein